jgi:hypothetical protein
MTFTFITCYIQLDELRNETYFNHFYKLAEMNFPIILFFDKKLENKINLFEKYKNVTIKLIDWIDLPINKYILDNNIINIEKPKKLDEPKDSVEYMILMNSKTFFMKLAKDITTDDQLVWIDFAGLKLTNDLEHFKKNFSNLKNYNKILIPGGFKDKQNLSEDQLMYSIHWRFLGTVYISPRIYIDKFYSDNYNIVTEMLNNKKITWEVNVWANIEANNDYIQHYRADHNKSLYGYNDVKIILLSMIKNEEKIITRCIESVRNICDAFCISDTRSTDNTINVINEYQKNNPSMLIQIYANDWSDFGSNRTISYKNTVDYCKKLGWDLDNTFGLLLDADMKLIVNKSFNKQSLTQNGYKMIQDTGHMKYHNIRLIKLNETWKCTGVTHEYWDGPESGVLDTSDIYIHDIGDGGCKDDKFQRDMKLLIKGIEEDPTNGRYHFYLAQTCKDLGKFKESIKLYKKRIELGGWYEEVWYSHYMIAMCYRNIGDIYKAEMWGNRAYEYRNTRPEPIYMLCNMFRERGQNIKAYHYYNLCKQIQPSNDSLFVESNIHKFQLDYENTILHYWVFTNDKLSGLKHIINYLNKNNEHESNVLSNMDHYIQKIPYDSIKSLMISDFDNYCASSSSIIKFNNKLIVNLRYVNYRIQHDGSYMMHDNGTYNHQNNVKTKNALVYMNQGYEIVTDPLFFDDNITDINNNKDSGIKGLEDIRLIEFKNKLYYTATSRQYSYDNCNRIVFGEYNITNLKYEYNKILIGPIETNCEKNWIPLNHNNEKILFIYNWHPLQIGILNEKNKLNIFLTYETPKFFKHYRGSTTVAEYDNKLWLITHGVKYYTPRKYYHQFIVLEKDTYKPIKHSVPFYFNNFKIEYCIGMIIENNEAVILFSENDMNTSLIRVNMNKLKDLMIDI